LNVLSNVTSRDGPPILSIRSFNVPGGWWLYVGVETMIASASRIASRTAARSSGALLEAALTFEARSKPTGLSRGAGFVGMEMEGTCIHDVVMVESDSVAAVKAALSRISEFPDGVPFTRPSMCIVWFAGSSHISRPE
jgi:hypothetical protein